MKTSNTSNDIQRMTVYFPSSLLNKIHKSATLHRRSFNKQVLWLVEQQLALVEDRSVGTGLQTEVQLNSEPKNE